MPDRHPSLPSTLDCRADTRRLQGEDASSHALAYVYGHHTRADADTAHVLTLDEALRIAANIAKLPTYLAANLDAVNE